MRIDKDLRQVTVNHLQGWAEVVHLADLANDPLGQHNPEFSSPFGESPSLAGPGSSSR